MKVRKTFTYLFFLLYFLFSTGLVNAQQTTIGLSFRPDYKKDFTWIGRSSPLGWLTTGWSNSVGLQFQHYFANERWGFRLGVFYMKRKTTSTTGGFFDPFSSSPISGIFRRKSFYMGIPLEMIFKVKPRLEIGLGLSSHHFIHSSTYINDERTSVSTALDAPIHVGLINSVNWVIIDKKWFNVKIGTTAIWPIESKVFIGGFQLTSNFKFP